MLRWEITRREPLIFFPLLIPLFLAAQLQYSLLRTNQKKKRDADEEPEEEELWPRAAEPNETFRAEELMQS